MSDVTCPICRRVLPAGAPAPTRPFCSARCKTIDLGNWLDDRYVIAGPPAGDPGSFDEEMLAALLQEPS
jgi:endogenous inhibitor of DNA gyrase (YacG/DUF329 family)